MPEWQLRRYAGFDELPDHGRALLEEAAGSFDQTLPWLQCMARLIPPAEDQLVIFTLESPGRPETLALLPILLSRQRLLGIGVGRGRALSNYYTALFAPVARPGAEPRQCAASFCAALGEALPSWASLDLNPLAVESPWMDAFAAALRADGCHVQRYFRFGNWVLDVAGRDFATYYAALPSRLRNTVRRKERKLRAAAQVDIEIASDADAWPAALAAYEQIYAKSWKKEEPHADFIRAVAGEFAQRDWLRIGVLRVDGVPAAAQIWFLYKGTASIFKLAYDPEFARYSVGSILSMALFAFALDQDGVKTVDYLCGDDAYKKDWMSQRRERWGLRANRWRSFGGCAGALRARLGDVLRTDPGPAAAVQHRVE